MRKILVVTTEGMNREDGNVYYSNYLIVESDTLKFDEPIFEDENFGPRGYRPLLTDDDTSNPRMNAVAEEIRKLVYTVTETDDDTLMFIEVKVG